MINTQSIHTTLRYQRWLCGHTQSAQLKQIPSDKLLLLIGPLLETYKVLPYFILSLYDFYN